MGKVCTRTRQDVGKNKMNEVKRFNLSLDDSAPHPKTGLHHESIVWCDRLIEKYGLVRINCKYEKAQDNNLEGV